MDNFAELLALLKSLLKIEDVDTSQDAALTVFLNGAITACDKYLDRIKISKAEVTETWLRERFPRVLRYSPVGDLTAVTLDGEDVLSSWKLMHKTDFAELHHVDDSTYCLDDEELVVTYEAGFSTCPYDLMLAICWCAAKIYEQTDGDDGALGAVVVKESVTGVGSVEFDTSMSIGLIPAETRQVLDLYRGMYG